MYHRAIVSAPVTRSATGWTPTGRTPLLTALARWAAPRWRRSQAAVSRGVRLLFRLLLTITGLGLISAAAWVLWVPAGLVVAGLSCLVLEWAVKRE